MVVHWTILFWLVLWLMTNVCTLHLVYTRDMNMHPSMHSFTFCVALFCIIFTSQTRPSFVTLHGPPRCAFSIHVCLSLKVRRNVKQMETFRCWGFTVWSSTTLNVELVKCPVRGYYKNIEGDSKLLLRFPWPVVVKPETTKWNYLWNMKV